MLQITKILGIKTLFKLKINIISVKEFAEKDYNERIKYFRIFYIKTYSLFKIYNKHYNLMIELENKLTLIIKIDPLDYIDKLEDSSSSLILSEELLNVNLDLDNFDDYNEIFDFNNSSENRDTPYFPSINNTNIDDTNHPQYKINDNNEIFDNTDTPYFPSINNTNIDDTNNPQYNINDDNESDIFDLFVKN